MAGCSLDDIMATTHIGRGYLTAMEEGCFERLPSPAHAKGFLRLYAQCVGLSGDELVRSYDESSPSHLDRDADTGRRSRPSRPIHHHWSRRWGVTAVLAFVVLVLALIMDLTAPQRPPSVSQTKPAEPSPVPPAPPTVTIATPVTPAASQPPVSVELSGDIPKMPAGGIFLRIRAIHDSWLAIDIDGELSHQYTLKEGDIIEWKGEREFSLDIGNPAGIQIEFNGKPHPLPVEGDKPFHLVLAADVAR